MATIAIMLIVAAALVAAAFVVNANRAERRGRRDLLVDCVPLLDGGAITPDAAGYGVLRGRYQGVDVALRPFSESLAFRRLPQLWLAVTVALPTGAGASIDVLRRSSGAEYYSPGDALPRRLRPPASWPQEALVKASDGADALLAGIEPHLRPLLANDRVKNVTVTPRGVRVVTQHREGERGAYLIYRDSRFVDARVTQAEAKAALDAALAAARGVRGPDTEKRSDGSDGLVDAA